MPLRIYNIARGHSVLLILLFFWFCSVIGSRWVTSAYHIPLLAQRIVTAALYGLYFAFAAYAFVKSVLTHNYSIFILLLYCFVAYCIALIIVRIKNGMNVKNTIYFVLIFVGSVCGCKLLYDQYCNGRISSTDVIDDIVNFGLWVVFDKCLFDVCFKKSILYYPLNVNKMSCILLAFIPCTVIGYMISGEKKSKLLVAGLLFSGAAVLSGSRAAFWLLVFEAGALFLIFSKHHYKVCKYIALVLSFVMFIVFLYVFDIGNVRYTISRALGFAQQQIAQQQIQRSDAGRRYLWVLAYQEFLKAPLFGTGNVFYEQSYGNYVFNQAAHNFILETLGCFGLIGLLMLAILLYSVYKAKINFNKSRLFVGVMSVTFWAYAFVEPLLYDPLTSISYGFGLVSCLIVGDSFPGDYFLEEAERIIKYPKKAD